MKTSSRTPDLDAQPARRRRGATFAVGALLALGGVGLGAVLILQSRGQPQPTRSPAPVTALAKPTGPTYVVENTLFGRRVRLVTSESPSAATADPVAKAP